MTGDGRLRHAERRRELRHVGITLGQPGQDGPPGGVRQRVEDGVELLFGGHRCLYNHPVL